MKRVLLMVSGLILLLFAVWQGGLFGGELLKTGQFTSYTDYDDGWWVQQSDIGVSFSYQTADPTGAGEVVTIDNVTGLMWASDGNAGGCNFGDLTNWSSAIDWAQNLTFAGYSDWRLPNIRELLSLVVEDARYYSEVPAINHIFFPGTQRSLYLSSTTDPYETDYTWLCDFAGCALWKGSKVGSAWVRAVRGGE